MIIGDLSTIVQYKYHLLMYSRKIKFQATMFFICVFLSTYMKAFFFSLARNQFLTEHTSFSLMHDFDTSCVVPAPMSPLRVVLLKDGTKLLTLLTCIFDVCIKSDVNFMTT